jgi:predicted transport protein
LLANRPAALVELYEKLGATVRGFGTVEVVTRDRYALFRTTRIFADLTVMRDALRVVIHLGREAKGPYFIKVVHGDQRISHVAKIRTWAELQTIAPLLREAYELAASEESRGAV